MRKLLERRKQLGDTCGGKDEYGNIWSSKLR